MRRSKPSSRTSSQRKACLIVELLEDRNLLNGDWLLRLQGLPGDTTSEQMHATQVLLQDIQVHGEDIEVRGHMGPDGYIFIETPDETTEEELNEKLCCVPGFIDVQESEGMEVEGADPDLAFVDESPSGANLNVGLVGNEPTIAVNPFNANNVVVAQFNNGAQTLKISLDGGATFPISRNAVLATGQTFFQGDDSIAFDSQGRLFWTYLSGGSPAGPNVIALQVNPTTGAVIGTPSFVATSNLDKEWLTADKTPSSPFHDNLYVTWNDFNQTNAPVRFARSTNQGVTWTTLAGNLSGAGEGFTWPSELTVAPNGDVWVGWHTNTIGTGANGEIRVRRSTDGGLTFGPEIVPFPGGTADIQLNAGASEYSAPVPPRINKFKAWLQGSLQPRILVDPVRANTLYVVSVDDPDNVYDAAGDPSNIVLAKSTDNGANWTRTTISHGAAGTIQVMPAAAIDTAGNIAVTWYDSRSGLTNISGDYLLDVYSTTSFDGGVTFSADVKVNDIAFDPDLGAPDRFSPNQVLRIGEYNGLALAGGNGYAVWTGNTATGQQIVFGKFSVGFAVAGSIPAASQLITTTPNDFVIQLNSPVDATSVQPSDLTVNGIAANSTTLNGPGDTITFHYNTSPVSVEGLQSMAISAGALARQSDGSPVSAFFANFRYDPVPLTVTTTAPPVGGIFTLPGPFTYDVNFSEAFDPASLQAADLVLSGIAGATVTGVTPLPGNTTARFTLGGITVEGTLTASIASGAITDPSGNPVAAFSANYIVDVNTVAYPTPLTSKPPSGSLVYDPTVTGTIAPAGDTDNFTLNIDAGQTVTVVVAQAGLTMYGGVGNGGINPGALLVLNQTTAAGTLLSDPTTPGGLSGLAFDPATSVFFGSTIRVSGGTSLLVRLDPNTGTLLSTVGPITAGSGGPAISIGDMALQPGTNTLFGIRSNADGLGSAGLLYTIDKNTGVATLIGNTNAGVGGGIAFTPGGTLFQTARTGPGGSFSLNTINPTNAARIATLTLPVQTFYDGLAVRPTDGVLFAATGGTNDQIFTINPTTGVATLVGSTGAGSTSDIDFGRLVPTITLRDPSNAILGSASATGLNAVLQTVATTTAGVYTVTVAGGTGATGTYTAQVILNAAEELERNTGQPTNDTAATAQNINPTFLSLGGTASRGAVLGTVSATTDLDFYSMTLTAGDSVTVALKGINSTAVTAQLRDSTGATILANANAGPTNLDKVFNNFVVSTSGTYNLVIGSTVAGATYDAVVTRNADFDTEANNAFATAQNLGASKGALGLVQGGSGTTYNFESGQQGWTINNTILGTGSAAGLWHLSTRRSGDANHSPVTSFYYGSETTGNYDTGARNSGAIVSPSFVVAAGATASFKYFLAGEGGSFDTAILQVSNNGGASWTNLLGPLANASTFTSASASLSSFVGQTVQIRFFFDTVDAISNTFEGWYVDDVQVGGAADDDWYSFSVNTGDNLAIQSRTPADGPGEFVNTLNPKLELYNPSNVLVASGLVLLDGRNESISYIALATGLYRLRVQAEGNTTGEYAVSVTGNTGAIDNVAPRVSATSVASNAVVLPGSLTYTITFNEAMKVSNLTSDDFTLRGNFRAVNYTASTFSFNPAGTVLTLTYSSLPDDNYTLTLVSGTSGGTNFTDAAGNALDGEFAGTFPSGNGAAGGNFVIGFNMDPGTLAFPTPLTAELPLGSLIYDPTTTTGTIAFVGDTDSFTLAVDPGQTITVVITPTTTTLVPTVSLLDPASTSLGSATAPSAGQKAILQTIATTTGGTYTITVGGASSTTGLYTVQVTLNAAREVEPNGGVTNSTLATAQSLTSSFVSLGGAASRGAVLGVTDGSSVRDFYSFALAAGDTATLALQPSSGTVNLTLQDPSGVTLAVGTAGPTNVSRIITDFKATTTGTYFAFVDSVTSALTYALVITRNAEFDTEPNDALATAQPFISAQVAGEQRALGYVASGTVGTELYRVNLTAGTPVTAQTSTPADGPNQFVNTLNPRLRILDSAGTQLALDDNSAPDGRNAKITSFVPAASGTYYVEVSSTTATATTGEYVLSLNGATIVLPPFQVTTTTPANGAVLLTAPTTMVVDFNDAYLANTVQASDLQVDGVNATAFTLTDGDTVTFNLVGGYGPGLHTVTMAAGSVIDVQNTPLAAYTGGFTIDNIAPRVTATSVAPGAVLAPGSLTYQVTFSEGMKVANLTSDDFTLHGNFRQAVGVNYSASSFSFNPAGTVLTLNYAGLPDDSYTLTLVAGVTSGTNFTDAAGNALDGEFSGTFPSGNGLAGGNFVIGFSMDLASEAYATPLTPKLPLGSLIYDPSMARTIAFADDSDSFTLAVDPGQTISVLVTPTTATLRPAVELRDPANALVASATASAAGQAVFLNPVGTTVSGIYTIVVSGAASTTGLYTAQVTLNAALEAENNGGTANDSRATAQNIDASFITLQTSNVSAARGAVLGGNSATSDFYSFTLGAGNTTTLALKALTAGTVNVELQNAGGTVLATGTAGATNLDKVISNFTAPTAGTYFARISGDASATYSLVVTRNAAFDTETNDTFATAQGISGVPGALGAITVTASSKLYATGNDGVNLITINTTTGLATTIGSFGFPQTYAAAFTPDGTLWTIVNGFGATASLATVNQTTGAATIVGSANFTGSPLITLEADAAGNLYGGNFAGSFYSVNKTTGQLTLIGPLGFSNIMDTAFDNAGALWAVDGNNGLYQINPVTGAGTFKVTISGVNGTVMGLMVDPTDNSFYVTTYTSTSILYRLNAVTGATTAVGSGVGVPNAHGGDFTLSSSGADSDWYSINVTNTANVLRLETSTPADGPNQFVNTLNPKIELYNPSNVLVASGTVTGDGRNEFIQYQPLVTGAYRVRVTGEGATSGEYFLSKNFSPAPTATVTSPINENSSATLSGTVGDPDTLDTHTVVITWGPGEGSTTLTLAAGVSTFNATHQYLDDNPTGTPSDVYPLAVTVTDNHGASGTATTSSGAAPAFYATSEGGSNLVSINQNTGVATTIGSFGYQSSFTGAFTPDGRYWTIVNSAFAGQLAQVNLTTGQATPVGAPPVTTDWIISLDANSAGQLFAGGHSGTYYSVNTTTGQFTPVGQGIYTCDFAFDASGNLWAVDGSFTLYQLNPTTGALLNSKQMTGLADMTMSIEVDPSNTFYVATTSSPAQLYRLDPATGATTLVGTNLGVNYIHGGDFLPAAPPTGGPLTVTVNNVAPSNIVLNSGVINENDTFTLNGAFVDPGTLDVHTVTINWGEGAPETHVLPVGARSFSYSHQYLDDNPTGTPADDYTVYVAVTDDDTGVGTGSTIVTVKNVAPILTSLTPAGSIDENGVFALNGAFHDDGTQDTHTIVINWGGGSAGQPAEGSTTLTTAGPNPAGTSLTYLGNGDWSFSATHQYLDDNPTGTSSDNFTVSVSLTDDDQSGGAPASAFYATSEGGNNLVSINKDTGIATTIGSLGSPSSFTGAFTPDGRFWTIINSAFAGQLAEVNLTTGLATPVGAPPVTNDWIISLDANPAGQLFAGSHTGTYYSVNTATGQFTAIAQVGIYTCDFAFDTSGNLWAVDGSFTLYQLNPSTGALLNSKQMTGLAGTAMSIEVDPSNNFYVATTSSPAQLYRLDPATGATTLVGTNLGVNYIHGGDFLPAVLPAGGDLTVTVNNVAPVIDTLSATSVNENGTVHLTGTYHDVGTQDTHKLTIDWGEGVPQTVTVSGGSFDITHQYLDDNPTGTASDVYTIAVTLTDDDTGAVNGSTTTTITNVAPVIDTLSATSVNENGTVHLTGTYHDVGTQDTHKLTIDWGEGAPQTVTVSGGSFDITHQYLDDNPTATASDVYTVAVTLTDDDTSAVNGSTTSTITNVAPIITSISNSSPAVGMAGEGETVTVSGTFTDVGTQDTHTATINWGDGNTTNATISEAGGSGSLTGSHAYASGGIYTVTVTLKDDDGAVVSTTTTTVIVGVGVVGDTLYVIGTDNADHISVNQAGSVYRVHADFLTTGSYRDVPTAGVNLIVVQAGDGDDQVTVSGGITLPTIIDGGKGADHLNGGNGPNIVIGGDGDDTLLGGTAKDILIGGQGADRIVGNSSDDILIAGSTSYDANYTALKALIAVWNTDASYASRVAAVQSTSATYHLITDGPSQTVFSDHAVDQITGSAGSDLFYANTFADSGDDAFLDTITDAATGESILDIDVV